MKFFIGDLPVMSVPVCSLSGELRALTPSTDADRPPPPASAPTLAPDDPSFPYDLIYPEQYNYMCDLKRALDANVRLSPHSAIRLPESPTASARGRGSRTS